SIRCEPAARQFGTPPQTPPFRAWAVDLRHRRRRPPPSSREASINPQPRQPSANRQPTGESTVHRSAYFIETERWLSVKTGSRSPRIIFRIFAAQTWRPVSLSHRLRCYATTMCDCKTCEFVAPNFRSSYNEPQDHGFMYGHGFQDLDGHIWEPIVSTEERPTVQLFGFLAWRLSLV